MSDQPANDPIDETHEFPTIVNEPVPPLDADETVFPDELDEWPVRGPARGVRLAVPAAALVGVMLLACGFWGGAELQKHRGGSGSNAAGFAALASRFRSGTNTSTTSTTSGTTGAGFGGFGGGAGSSDDTTGTISVVDGNTLYVLTSSGALVKVTLASSTTVTRNAKSASDDLRPGDTVVVTGATGKNGNVSATSVAATAPGVTSSSGFGGFTGRFGGGTTSNNGNGGSTNG